MRDAIDSIMLFYDLYAGELRGQISNEKSFSSSTTQTSPWMRNQEGKKRQEEIVEIREAKRTSNPAPRVLDRRTTKATLRLQVNTQESAVEPGWQMVTEKKRRNKKTQERKLKLNAIMIRTRDNTLFGEPLKENYYFRSARTVSERITSFRGRVCPYPKREEEARCL